MDGKEVNFTINKDFSRNKAVGIQRFRRVQDFDGDWIILDLFVGGRSPIGGNIRGGIAEQRAFCSKILEEFFRDVSRGNSLDLKNI